MEFNKFIKWKISEKDLDFICDGFICDWKNKKEYKLLDFLGIISNKNELQENKKIV